MLIGVPKEIKTMEHRVGLVTASIRELVHDGHQVIIETNAGSGIGIDDNLYRNAGADIVSSAREIFARAEMIVKVKEPQPEECKQLRDDQILFTYLHLAPDPKQAKLLQQSGVTAIAYETVTADDGSLPLLSPMSEVAGRLSIQAGAYYLEKPSGGMGILLGGVPGVSPGRVTVIGGGVVGTNAVRMAMGKEAKVTVLDKSLTRLKKLDLQFGSKLNTIYATQEAIEEYTLTADLVIGAVLVPGAAAPQLMTRNMISRMRAGSVVVDVAIDQGGCFETSKPTTHAKPIYVVDNVIHYCVANMPGCVPRTATFALNNATMPFVLALANKGYKQALLADPHLLNGLNVHKGKLTHEAVATALGKPFVPAQQALAN